MADDQTAALIAEARSYFRNAPRWKSRDNQEAETAACRIIAELADALERAQGIIDGVRELDLRKNSPPPAHYRKDREQ